MQKVWIIWTWFWKHIAKSFSHAPWSEVIWISWKNKEKTIAIAKSLSEELDTKIESFNTWQELVESNKINLVCIVSPNALHAEMFFHCLKFNKDILLDKPADVNSLWVKKMLKAVNTYEWNVFINHWLRAHPVVKEIIQIINSKSLGKITSINIAWYLNIFSKDENLWSWYRKDLKWGWQLISYGIHLIDLARYLTWNQKLIDWKIIKGSFLKENLWNKKEDYADSQFSWTFVSESWIHINIFNTTYCQALKDFKIEIFWTDGLITYSDKNWFYKSINNKPFENINYSDILEHSSLWSSIVSKSTKYLARDIIDYLEWKEQSDASHISSLEDAYYNMMYLEENFKDTL